MAFTRGGQQAEEAAKANRKSFAKVEYLQLEDGETTVIRLLDDSPDWIFVKQHSFVDTKDAPSDMTDEDRKKWPAKMNAICRYDKAIDGDNCYICDNLTGPKGKPLSPGVRLWVRAVIREEVKGTQAMADAGDIPESKIGRIVGFRDAEHDVEETDAEGKTTGKTVRRKKMVLINMGMKNFFGALQGYFDMHGTVLDRDYRVTRKGSNVDTDYTIIGCDPIEGFDLNSDPELRARYEKFAAEQGLSVDDLEKMLLNRGSEEYYARFFDPTAKVPPRVQKERVEDHPGGYDEFKPRNSDVVEQTGGPQIDEDRIAAMRERVRSGGRKQESAAN